MENQGFIDPTNRTGRVIDWLYLAVFCLLAESGVWLFYFVFQIYSKYTMTTGGIDLAIGLTALLPALMFFIFIAIFIVTSVFLFMWIHQINYNAHCLGATNMTFTPGWSIIWFFIPVANFIKPIKIMNELWKTSKNPKEWQNLPDNSVVNYWWTLCIWSYLIAIFSNRFYKEDVMPAKLFWPPVLYFISCILSILAGFALLSLVKKIHSMQMSHFQSATSPTSTT